MELAESRPKPNYSKLTLQSPFPVPIESFTGESSSSAVWKMHVGKFNGDCVVVCDPGDVFRLHLQGFFGKGSLSRSYPDFGNILSRNPRFIRKRQWDLRCSWDRLQQLNTSKKCKPAEFQVDETDLPPCNLKNVCTGSNNIEPDISTNSGERSGQYDSQRSKNNSMVINEREASKEHEVDHEYTSPSDTNTRNCSFEKDVRIQPVFPFNDASLNQEKNPRVFILPDSDYDDDDENYLVNMIPELKMEPFSPVESLHLSLEESFFLSYALGCLQVSDLSGKDLSLTDMWQLFCESQPDFIEMYVVYHYFRAKNWVVKSGVKVGGDFVLYKHGPPFYHASFIVKVEVIDEKTGDRIGKPGDEGLKWTKLMGLHRVAKTTGKDFLLCQVVWPSNLPINAFTSPKVLSKFTVNEVLVRRWISAKERESELEDH